MSKCLCNCVNDKNNEEINATTNNDNILKETIRYLYSVWCNYLKCTKDTNEFKATEEKKNDKTTLKSVNFSVKNDPRE